MELLTTYQLRNKSEAHFDAVRSSPDIDQFCSSLDWMLPAYEAFIPDHPLFLSQSDEGFVTLARGFNPRIGRYLQPLEASWCLASPFAGPDPDALVEAFCEDLRRRKLDWDVLYLSGIPQSAAWLDPILRNFGRLHRVGLGHETKRFIARLDGGVDGFLGRRSAKFRANLRHADRRSQKEGITFEVIKDVASSDVDNLYERILGVEERSWKGKLGTGILDGGMNAFYRIMLPRLAKRGALRVVFANHQSETVGFVFGGLLASTYRGLQLSYDGDFDRYSLGNLLQYRMIETLCEESVESYDLGSELEYKARWAEARLTTVTLWIWR